MMFPRKHSFLWNFPMFFGEVNHLGMMINGYTCGRFHKSDCGMYTLLRQPGTTWECHPNTWEDDMGKMTKCTWADPKDTCHTLFLSQQMYIHFFEKPSSSPHYFCSKHLGKPTKSRHMVRGVFIPSRPFQEIPCFWSFQVTSRSYLSTRTFISSSSAPKTERER